MKIEVTIFARNRCVVVFTPTWLDRLLGEKIEERVAVAFPSLPSGNHIWHYESNARPVPHRVTRLINEALIAKERARLAK